MLYAHTKRAGIVGKSLWEAFPVGAGTQEGERMKNLVFSLQEVLSTKKPHQMALQRYDVPRPQEVSPTADNSEPNARHVAGLGWLSSSVGARPGFIQTYWLPSNTPVLNEAGEVQYIIHKVQDVTELVTQEQKINELQQQALGLLKESEAGQKEAQEALRQSEAQILELKDEIAQKATNKYLTLFHCIDEGFYQCEVIFDVNNKPVDIHYLVD